MSSKQSTSVFQESLKTLKMLQCVEGWRDDYYDPAHDHPSCANKTPMDVLWMLFRQGGTLCMCVNLVQKNTIREIYPLDLSDSKPFDGPYCKKNVYNFLLACSEDLFMPEDELFQVADLYKNDISVYVKVLRLVEGMLVRFGSAKNIDFSKPFKSKKELEDEAASSELSSKNQSIMSMREKVIDEILVTERNYVADLERLKAYKDVVMSDKNCTLSQESLDRLFCNLDELVEFQRRFLIDMEALLYGPVESRLIGKHFVDSLSKMELGSFVQNKKFTTYYEFCSNYPRAIHEATVCAEDLRKYDKIIPSGHLPSFLIKPVQRICKYPLLLRELLKHTDSSDSDYPNIANGLDVMKKIAANVNEENRRGENRLLAEDFAKRVDDWKGLDFQEFGSLNYMDTFIARFSDTEKEYLVYFFDEYILFCKEGAATKKKDYKEIILRHIVASSSLVNANDASMRGKFIIRGYWKEGLDFFNFSLECRTEETSLKWLSALNEKVQANKRNIQKGSKTSSPNTQARTALDDSISEKAIANSSKLEKMLGESISSLSGPKAPSSSEEVVGAPRSRRGSRKASALNSDSLNDFESANMAQAGQITRLKIRAGGHAWILKFDSRNSAEGYFYDIRETAWSRIKQDQDKFRDLKEAFGDVQDPKKELLLYYIDSEKDEIELSNEADLLLCLEECAGKACASFSVVRQQPPVTN